MKRLALPSSTRHTRLPRWAHVEERVEPALAVAGQDDRVFAHIGVEKIIGRGHQALMPDHQPGAPEDLFHFEVVDRLVAEDAAVELAGGGVDNGVFPSGAHRRISSRGHDSISGGKLRAHPTARKGSGPSRRNSSINGYGSR